MLVVPLVAMKYSSTPYFHSFLQHGGTVLAQTVAHHKTCSDALCAALI